MILSTRSNKQTYYLAKARRPSPVRVLCVTFILVKGPQEATLDSHLLLMATNLGAQKARAMKSGSGAFDVDDFISKLVTFMRGTPSLEDRLPDDSESEDYVEPDARLKWDLIGRRAMAKSRRVALQGFMCVPLSSSS